MEHLPDTALSVLLTNINKGTLNTLSRTSKSISDRLSSIKSNYAWKLMTEAYLGMDIPLENDDWESVYKFVTLIGDKLYLLFTREVFYAELGLLLESIPPIKHIEEIPIDTLEYLLTVLELDHVWKSHVHIRNAARQCRDDLALLLAKDERCFRNPSKIWSTMKATLEGGCGKTFMYLRDKYPAHVDHLMVGGYSITAACYGLEDVVQVLGQDPNTRELLNFVRTGRREGGYLPKGVHLTEYVDAMVKSGHLSSAIQFDFYPLDMSSIYRSMCIAIRNGAVTDLASLEPYTKKQQRVPAHLLGEMVKYPRFDLEMIRHLTSLTPKDWLPRVVKSALSYGNWEYAVVICEFI